AEELRGQIQTILAAARTDDVVVSLHGGPETQRATVLVVIPRERFSDEARAAIRDEIASRVAGRLLDEQVVFVEGDRALLHLAFAAGAAPPPVDQLRAAVAAVVRSWEEAVSD